MRTKTFYFRGWAFWPIVRFNLEGAGDFLCSSVDRYTSTVSVPYMHNTVGRAWVAALRSKCWQEAWEARRQQQAVRVAAKKKKEAKNWEKAKRGVDSIGGNPI